ncbi:MAG: cation-transporting P-type ATPase, partial [Verrucomicrobiota bacterium]
MKPETDQRMAPEPKSDPGAAGKTVVKPATRPDPKDDLKTLPLAELEKRLESSPDGLTQVEAQKRLTKYGPNELIEKKTNL